jgi:uncharacterized protein YcfJ
MKFSKIILRIVLLAVAALGSGCAVVTTSNGSVTYVGVPFALYDRPIYNRAQTTYENPMWAMNSDSHPAVRRPAGAARVTPVEAGAQNVPGDAVEKPTQTASSARGGCSEVNSGTLWGAIAGAWVGSLFGGGRGRDVSIALGLMSGAITGTETVSGRRCL